MPMISEHSNLTGFISEIMNDQPSVTGTITPVDAEITGFINTDCNITGTIINNIDAIITGSIVSENCELTAAIEMPSEEAIEIYRGIVNVVPSTSQNILLKTQYKKVIDDITVYKISYSEVTNLSGGYTVTIGE